MDKTFTQWLMELASMYNWSWNTTLLALMCGGMIVWVIYLMTSESTSDKAHREIENYYAQEAINHKRRIQEGAVR